MKKILVLAVLIACTVYLISCNEERSPSIKSAAPSGDTTAAASKPSAPNISAQKLQAWLNSEIREALATSNDSIRGEGVLVIVETHNAIRQLLSGDRAGAIKAIESALGKSEVITTADPRVGFLPIEATVSVRDLIADIETLRRAKDEIEDLTDKGYLQTVRELVDIMVSEIRITTSNLPLQTYPVALKTAVQLVRDNKAEEAAVLLNAALNTIVSIDRSIPLPLVRAELMLVTADSLIKSTNNVNEEEINTLLDNADYQIRFAEELGYGKRDKEFKDFAEAIKELKREVADKSPNRQNSISSLIKKLNAFKNRISPESQRR